MSAPTFETTEPRTCGWAELPDAVRHLWTACMDAPGSEDVARALTSNFLGVATKANEERLRAATRELQRRGPCRAFLFVLDDDAAGAPAELRATTRLHGRIRDIVLEELVIRLPRKQLADMPGVIRPLVIDDLPSRLFWSLPWPANEGEFDVLASLCGAATVDSREFGNPARELAALQERREQGQRIVDLSWLRALPWRRALGEAFERVDWRPGTPVTGLLRHGRNARAGAMLLSDWLHDRLAAQLSIEPDGDATAIGPDHVALKVGDVEIVVELQGEQLVSHVTTQTTCYLPFSIATVRGSDAELLAAASNR